MISKPLGVICGSEPCFGKAFPAVCAGFISVPPLVIGALVAEGTLNSFAANFKTVVKSVFWGTLSICKAALGPRSV